MAAPSRPSHAFTLLELLIVVGVITLLIMLLLPSVQASREQARHRSCTHNMSQLALAIQQYEALYRIYPPGTINDTGPIRNVAQGYHHGWLVRLLPHLEQDVLFEQVDFTVGVYHKRNKRVRETFLGMLTCPSDMGWNSTISSYAGVHHDTEAPIDVDNNGVFFLNSKIRIRDVRDGLGYTFFLGEKLQGGQFPWMSGTRDTLRNTGSPIGSVPLPTTRLYVGGFDSQHRGGANFSLGSGEVRFIYGDIDLTIYQQLGHRADGSLINWTLVPPASSGVEPPSPLEKSDEPRKKPG